MKTIKLLLTTIAVLLCSVIANAYDFEVDGIYYNILSSTDLTAEVTHGDNKYTGNVIIPSTINYKSRDIAVIAIGDSAFYGCDGLSNSTIPSSVTSIGWRAFFECTSLTSITISNSVTDIGDDAFRNCISLTSITIPNSVTDIGDQAFLNCISLTSITIPNSVTDIGDRAFHNCTSLKELYIEDGDTNLAMGIGSSSSDKYNNKEWHCHYYGLFHDCPLEILYIGRDLDYETEESKKSDYSYDYYYYYYSPFYDKNLKSVTIGNLVTTIREELFNGCSVKKITIPKNVISIEDRAFQNCTLKELCIEDGGAALELGNCKCEYSTPTYYYQGLFGDYCYLDSLYIGRNLTYKIEREGGSQKYYYPPFYNSRTLKSVTIGDSVTVIGEKLFYSCTKLTYAKIGNNVTDIQNRAFSCCDSLRSITIPSSVVKIGKSAFAYCDSLKYVNIKDSKKTLSTGEGIFDDCSFKEVYLGRNLLSVNFVDIDSLTIGSNVTKIEKNMFSGGANISSIYSMCTNPPVIESGNDFTESQYVNTTVFIPKGSLNAYQTADVWKNFWDIQEYCLDKKFCVNYYIDEELYAVDSVKHGDTIIPRVEPQKENYEFSGWSYIPKTMPAEDVMVTGTFTANTYTITYMVDEEIFAIDTIAYGDTIVPIAEPTKEGYTFSGWSEIPETMPAENIVIDGYFSVNYYAINYIVDNEPFATDSVAYGDTIILRDKPQKEDYKFSGWSEAPETMPAHDIEVYGNFFIFTTVTDVQVDPEQSQKVIEDNQLFIILSNGKKYNVMGQEM